MKTRAQVLIAASLFTLVTAVLSLSAVAQPATNAIVATSTPTVVGRLTPAEVARRRLEWNMKTLVGAYDKVGSRNQKWDAAAREVLTAFAEIRCQSANPKDSDRLLSVVQSGCERASAAGCDDAMISYLHARNREGTPKDISDALIKAAAAMDASSYPEIRKCYASMRAQTHLKSLIGIITNSPEANRLRSQTIQHLAYFLADETAPPGEVQDACLETLELVRNGPKATTSYWEKVEAPLFKGRSEEPVAWLVKGATFVRLAWAARGPGYADKVSGAGWQGMAAHLQTAEEALDHAWKLDPSNPRIAREMMTVELGQAKGIARLDVWFKRAMALNPKDDEVCESKRYYLEPKWHGSAEEMLEFGRECVMSKEWGGRVPLILVKAHTRLVDEYLPAADRAGYWKRPEVWRDIKAAYERYLRTNPDDSGALYNFIWYANAGEHWDKVNELVPKLGKDVDYSAFDGKAKFDEMVSRARKHATKPESEK